jgi:hypothetical protein
MPEQTFSERFCHLFQLEPKKFEATVFRMALYPQASVLGPVLRLLHPGFFEVDLELVRNVGLITDLKQFRNLAWDFSDHPANRTWLRRNLRMRLSTQRLLRLLRVALTSDSHEVPSPGGTQPTRLGAH